MNPGWIEQVAAHARLFGPRGWLPATAGNFSARTGAGMTVSRSGADKAQLTSDDFVACDRDGRAIDRDARQPSAEAIVHAAIYRTIAEAHIVYHAHPIFCVLCADRDQELGAIEFARLELIKALGVWEEDGRVRVPIVSNDADLERLARSVAAVAQPEPEAGRAVVVAGHGLYAWGADPFAAKRHLEALAYLCEYSWRAQSVAT